MNKAVFFSIVTIAFFTLLLSYASLVSHEASFYSRTISDTHFVYLQEELSSSFFQLYDISFDSIVVSEEEIYFLFNNFSTVGLSYTTLLEDYVSFIEGPYSLYTNRHIIFNDDFETLHINPFSNITFGESISFSVDESYFTGLRFDVHIDDSVELITTSTSESQGYDFVIRVFNETGDLVDTITRVYNTSGLVTIHVPGDNNITLSVSSPNIILETSGSSAVINNVSISGLQSAYEMSVGSIISRDVFVPLFFSKGNVVPE